MELYKSDRKIQCNIPLKDKTWFQTGGPAKRYTKPSSLKEFQDATWYANNNNLDIFVLGAGANILISDEGFDGLVIHPNIRNIVHQEMGQETIVTARAGATIDELICYCHDNNITGLEEFSGIPGTVGGSIYINIHYFGFFISQFLIKATVIDRSNSKIETVDKDWFKFGYDKSKLMNEQHFLLDATFLLKKADKYETAYAKGRSIEIIRHRNARYPTSHTCGSFFRNFSEDEVNMKIKGTNKKMIYVAYYLDKIGVKGNLSVGGAIVSHKHANMIVNTGDATSSDIIHLALRMQNMVKEKFGIVPQPECQLIGFKECPLIPSTRPSSSWTTSGCSG